MSIVYPELEPGMVVRITSFDKKPCDTLTYVDRAETDDRWVDLNFLSGDRIDGDPISFRLCTAWEVVPDEEWTDEICVLMAKRALLGEANN